MNTVRASEIEALKRRLEALERDPGLGARRVLRPLPSLAALLVLGLTLLCTSRAFAATVAANTAVITWSLFPNSVGAPSPSQ